MYASPDVASGGRAFWFLGGPFKRYSDQWVFDSPTLIRSRLNSVNCDLGAHRAFPPINIVTESHGPICRAAYIEPHNINKRDLELARWENVKGDGYA